MNKWLIGLTGVPAIVAMAVLVPDPALAQTAKAPVAVKARMDTARTKRMANLQTSDPA